MSKLMTKSMIIAAGLLISLLWAMNSWAKNYCSCNNLDKCQSKTVKQLCQEEDEKLEKKRKQFKNPFRKIKKQYEDKFSASRTPRYSSATSRPRTNNYDNYNYENNTGRAEPNGGTEQQNNSTSNNSQNTNQNNLVPLF